ncbi:MAG TPA: nicotinamide riboside transporter PnuC [Edaphocola sp.]|nr:nicotinamide riboside transporter PnuC [Edaphocola sp.]
MFIWEFLKQIIWQEYLGVFLSMIQVLLARKNNPFNYLFGIGGVLLTMYVMFHARLYAEFTLNGYYLLMSIYGYYIWKYGKKHMQKPISVAIRSDWIKVVLIILFSFSISYWALKNYTNTDVPIWDSLVSAFAWGGMWLMAERKIENWWILNCSNLIAIPLMLHKDLYLYAFLSAFLFVVAIFGYKNWKHIMLDQKKVVKKNIDN